MASGRLSVVVTRRLPDVVETRMKELFDVRLRDEDTPMSRGELRLASKDFRAHRILFEVNIPAFENIAALEQLPPSGFTVIALPMKIARGSGGPLRIVAVIPSE